MIKNISISNYKSIDSLSLDLGRINVFIGENGAGKSNILEAIALAGAASADKLDNEFLTSRGIRVTPPEYMRPAFPDNSSTISVNLKISNTSNENASWELHNENTPYSKWQSKSSVFHSNLDIEKFLSVLEPEPHLTNSNEFKSLLKAIENFRKIQRLANKDKKSIEESDIETEKLIGNALIKSQKNPLSKSISDFIIYSPENSALRIFSREGQIEPLGINGEGLLRLLTVISSDQSMRDTYEEIKSSLRVLGWFDSLDVIADNPISRIEIQDKYIDQNKKYFDQLSANEGFLFLLFYFTLFSSNLTPKFFAIDNIDASLNPKLCQELMKRLVKMSIKHDKQIILTTHNPAILDGLNLDDDDQRLFAIRRDSSGYTRCKRVPKPESKIPNRVPKKLSELFMNGALGGLPNSF